MDPYIESARCECCGLKEDCTPDYILTVKADFNGRWLCGLCSEAVKDEAGKSSGADNNENIEGAVRAHMSFCGKFGSNPAVGVAQGMCQLLKSASSKRLGRTPLRA